MRDLVNQLNKLNKGIKLIIILVIVIVIGVLYYILGYQPKVAQLENLIARTSTLKSQLAEAEFVASQKDKLREETSLMEERLKHALTLLPNEKDIQGILRQLSILATKIGIDLKFFKPGGVVSKGLFSEIPIDIRLNGSYNEIAVYFDRVGKLSRIVNIRDISMGTPQKRINTYKVDVSCTAVTFMSKGGG